MISLLRNEFISDKNKLEQYWLQYEYVYEIQSPTDIRITEKFC